MTTRAFIDKPSFASSFSPSFSTSSPHHRERPLCASLRASSGPLRGVRSMGAAQSSIEASRDADASAVRLDGMHLAGQDKWLGGTLGSDGVVYGVPGTAKTVLRVVPETGEVSTFGGPFHGKFKWLRGVSAGSDIYCIPSNADSVLIIHTGPEPSCSTVGQGQLEGDWLYHGGVLAPDGCIYAVPCNATNVLKIETGPEPKLSFFGELSPSRQKWYGGILASDGCIYCVPNCADQVLKIVPGPEPTVELLGDLEPGGWKWHGGCTGSDGRIYGFPAHADSVLCIEPGPEPKVFTYGGPIPASEYRPDGKYKYGGGIAAGDAVYAFPSDTARVLKILPPDSDEPVKAKLIGPAFDDAHNKWQNGYVGPDGNVYAIPLNAKGVLQIVTATDEVNTIGCFEGSEKWEGGVEARDGALYCMPLREKFVMKIVPPSFEASSPT